MYVSERDSFVNIAIFQSNGSMYVSLGVRLSLEYPLVEWVWGPGGVSAVVDGGD